MKRLLIYTILILLPLMILSGCTKGLRTKGGTVNYSGAAGANVVLNQSEDPKAPSTIANKTEKTFEFVIPAGSQFVIPTTESPIKNQKGPAPTNLVVIASSNMPVKMTLKEDFNSVSGAAQKNIIGETIAKLNSLKWLSWVGVALFLFGLATMFYPPLKLIIASTTTSMAIAGGGLLLIVLPVMVVGNEILIFSCIFGGIAAYFFIYRYSSNSTKAKVYKDFIDQNKNGIDDRLEPPTKP